MSFILDGRDHLSRVLDRAGDSATRLHRRVSASMTNSSAAVGRFARSVRGDSAQINRALNSNTAAVRQFTTDSNGRLRDLRGRFISVSDAAQGMSGRLPQLTGRLGALAGAGQEAGASLGKGGGGLGAALWVIAGIVGITLLPALGALVPMMAGAGVAAGTLALGFKGVGEAAALASTDKKKYAEALAKLPAPAREFTKALVGVKDKISALSGPIQRTMLPGFTKALKDSGPLADILGKSMTEMAGGFGEAAAGAGRLMKDSGFQKDFATTLKLGNGVVKELTGSMGPFVRSLLDFGAASGPTLKSFSSGISGLLGKGGGGLAGMFDGLKVGIQGSSQFLDGFFRMINGLLPAIGRFSGEFARAFGPLLGETLALMGQLTTSLLDTVGTGLKWLSPLFKDLAFGVKAVREVLAITTPIIKDMAGAIFGALVPSFGEVDKAKGPFQRLSIWIGDNKGKIQEMGLIFANVVISMVSVAVENLPNLIAIFRMVTGTMVSALGGVLHAAASAFSWIPGVGDKLKGADQAFGRFKDGYISGLQKAEDKTRAFSQSVLPKLEQNRLQMNINGWQSQIETAKAKLKTVPPSKRADLLARINDLQAKVAQAKRELNSVRNKTVTLTTRRHYINITENRTINTGQGGRGVNAGGATGGLFTGSAFRTKYGTGGLVEGPGTGTSDSVSAPWLSAGEFVIKAKSVGKYGLELLRAINDGRFGIGSMTGAGQEAGRGLSAGLAGAAGGVGTAARQMAAAVTAGVKAELEIASPSKKMKALAADAGKGLIVGLTGSKAKISATAKDLVKDIWAAWKGSKSTKDSQLVAMVNRDTAKLQGLATKRDALAQKIAGAKQNAADWTAQARQQSELGSLGIEEGQVSAGSIQGALGQQLAKIKQFTAYIKILGQRGLAKSMLKQILNMGPEQGYAYASALAGASTSTLSSINSLQYSINSSTDALGRQGADSMYDAGYASGKGFLTGLTAQQKAIEAQMVKIAQGMQKAIKKALGIKSPSRVMAQMGRYSTEGLAAGLTERMPVLDQALAAVSGRVAATAPALGVAALPAGARGGPVVIHARFEITTLDPIAGAKQVRKMLLELQRTYGNNVNLLGA
ncbi:hypothetical protein ACFWM0_25080 [Streptomyces sp. NPDC058405]|uniref:hypothetical protein n=1 Tax=Streptomyces sp. NPDC058405 TaxID=3346482 RepID=UPI00365F333D